MERRHFLSRRKSSLPQRMLRNKTNNVMRRRVRLFITHLCFADLFVSLIMMPMEIGWHISNSWLAGDVMCRVLMFFRTFGFYLSSFILMAMSVDRYFAVKYPLLLSESRAKRMIAAAWILSAIASAPQVCYLQSKMNLGELKESWGGIRNVSCDHD